MGAWVMKLCEQKSAAGVLDVSLTELLTAANDTYENGNLLLDDPSSWFDVGNAGAVQNASSYGKCVSGAMVVVH